MATILGRELAEHRNSLTRNLDNIDFTKDVINKIFQDIEDEFELTIKDALKAVIDASTSPTVLSNNVKNKILIVYLRQKTSRERIR